MSALWARWPRGLGLWSAGPAPHERKCKSSASRLLRIPVAEHPRHRNWSRPSSIHFLLQHRRRLRSTALIPGRRRRRGLNPSRLMSKRPGARQLHRPPSMPTIKSKTSARLTLPIISMRKFNRVKSRFRIRPDFPFRLFPDRPSALANCFLFKCQRRNPAI